MVRVFVQNDTTEDGLRTLEAEVENFEKKVDADDRLSISERHCTSVYVPPTVVAGQPVRGGTLTQIVIFYDKTADDEVAK